MKINTWITNLFLLVSICIVGSCHTKDETIEDTSITKFEAPAIEDIIMYEINPGAFSTSGDFHGIINRLDSIEALGINTIWLMPVYPVGILNSFGSPYCVRNYTAVNPGLGTLSDLKILVQKAHERKIAVLLDWVGNHTSWDNTWMNNSNWYSKDGAGKIISPAGTNWTDVADLNYDNAEMRIAMISAMKYWVENADIDGFRCDAADFIPFDFWQQALLSLRDFKGKKLIMLAEGSRKDHFTAGFQMNFSWDYLSSLKNVFNGTQNVASLFMTNTEEYANVPEGCRKLRFTTNHDESYQATPITIFGGKKGALAASVIAIYLQGAPLIYCGQEVGVPNSSAYNGESGINWNENKDMLEAYKKLLNFYKTSEAARKGIPESFSDINMAVFQKKFGTEQILVIANIRASAETYTIPLTLSGDWVNALTNSTVSLFDTLHLSSFQYFILRK